MSNRRQYNNNNRQQYSSSTSTSEYLSTYDGSIPQLVPFVKENGIGPLIQDYNIQVKYHKTYKNLLLFKYDQISSPWDVAVVRECRAIILDRDNGWKVVSYPYNKFFNYGEKWADPIDWASATVYEKLDGSLAVLYYYQDEWWVSSSGMPDATGTLTTNQLRFCDLFWSIWKKMRYQMPKDTTKCYMFEMVTPAHTIVVQPKEEFIALHGCRDLTTMKELAPEPIAKEYGWRVVNRFPLTNIEEIVAAAGKLNPIQAEGFVICDKDFHRIKVKSPQYVALAHLSIKDKRKLNHRHMLEIIRHNEGDEFLAYFPQWSRLYKHVKQFYDYIAKVLDDIFVSVKSSLRRTAHALEENKNESAVISAKDIMDDSFKEKLLKKLIAEDMKQEKDHAMKILLKIYQANPTPSLKEYMSTCDIDEIMPLFDVWKQKNKFHLEENDGHAEDVEKPNTNKAREESKKDVEKMAFEELDGKLSKRQHDILANKLKKGEIDMNDLQKTKGARNNNNTNKKNNKEEDIDKVIKEIAEYDLKQASKSNNSNNNNTKTRNRKPQPKRRK